jgi:hypothetical protein
MEWVTSVDIFISNGDKLFRNIHSWQHLNFLLNDFLAIPKRTYNAANVHIHINSLKHLRQWFISLY